MRAFDSSKLVLWAAIALCSLAVPSHLNAQAQSQILPRITQEVNESSLVTLRGTVSPLANAQNDAGAASPDLRLERMQLVLQRSPGQEADLQQLIADMHTPGTANYHKWLTPTQFGNQFGPSDQDIQAIENWVESHGFQVGTLNPGKGSLEISGTVGQLQDAFHTSIHKYIVDGQPHFANANEPQIPAALAPVLKGFVSLNNFPVHRMSRYLGKATYDPTTGQATPQWTNPSGSSPLGYDLVLSPKDFYVQYDLNPLLNAGTNGAGQTIAIINDANINLNVVNNFRTLFGLPANPPQVIIDGNDPGIDGINNPTGPNYDSIEAYLDVEWSGAIAPNANIDFVIGADTAIESGLILAAERAIFSNLAPVMSLSFGACEQSLGSGNQFLNTLWEQAAAEGITVLVASGDNGSAGCDSSSATSASSGLAVSGYASTPFNVAVGGTDFFYSNYSQGQTGFTPQLASYWNLTPSATPGASVIKAPIPEQPWNDSSFGLNIFQSGSATIAGGSGGPSSCIKGTTSQTTSGYATCTGGYAKPAWQTGTGVPADNVRDIPDLSLFAADGLNDSFYPVCAADGDCQPGSSTVQISGVGGTSASTPAMAGIMALVNQKYGPQGQADFVLYPMAKQFPTAFHDVTNGTNAVPCSSGTPNCTAAGDLSGWAATAGYDLASGLGSVDANQLVTNWSKVTFTSSTTTFTPSSTSFTHGTSVNLKASVTGTGGTPTGTVTLATDNPTIDQQSLTTLTLSSGSATGSTNLLPGGTYNVWGQYSGDGTFAASFSAKTQLTVNPESSSLIFTVVTPQSSSSTLGGSSGGGYTPVGAGTPVPFGSLIILDGQVVPTSYYTQCNGGNSTSTACTNATFGGASGTVTFTDGSNTLNTSVINSEGDAEFNTGSLAIGPHTIKAAYSGDASYNASNATGVTFTVVQGSPTVNVSANLNPIAVGQTLVLTAVVESGGPGPAPTGTVKFANGTSNLGSATLIAGTDSTGSTGVGTLSIPSVNFGPGTFNIFATFTSGDSHYANAASTGTPLTVTAASGLLATTTTGSASASSTSPTAPVALTVTVTGQNGHPAPTGTVDFQSSGQDLGALSLPNGSGDTVTATINVNSSILYQGANTITLQYSGDKVYQPSSFTLPNPINNPLADFSMVAQTPVITVKSGSTATDTLNFTSVNGFNGSVALTCTAPSAVTCSISPSSLTVNGAATASLTIKATSTTAALHHGDQPAWFWASGGAALAGVFLLGLPNRRRKWQSLLGLMVIAILTAGIGCGGGSGSSSGSGSTSTSGGSGNSGNNGNTAVGSYTVLVTGTQGTTVTHNVAVSVQVQ